MTTLLIAVRKVITLLVTAGFWRRRAAAARGLAGRHVGASPVGIGEVVLFGVIVDTAMSAVIVGGGGRRAGAATGADGSASARKQRERSAGPQVAAQGGA